ncbi:MAG: hypothetical protein HQ541_21080 [Mariniphaga sp.]|nr:hypothetical protein [Mariniphaga sp.]
MKTYYKMLVLLAIIFMINNSSFSQVSISYYNSNHSKIGLGYDFSNRLWSEFRIYDSHYFMDFTPELVFCYDIIKKEKHSVYAGVGGILHIYNGIVIPIGTQIYLFEKNRRFSLHIEFQPTIDFENGIIYQSSLGIRYRFGDKYFKE